MNQQAIVDRPDREDRAARARIDAAAKLLRGGKSDVPDDFVALLFGRAAPEDLVGYEAAELAALAREAWAFVATRKPAAPKIRFEQPKGSDGEHLKSISVIEIVNDDIQDLKSNPPPVPVDDIAEAIQFLEWVAADNFTLLGVRDYTLTGKERDLKPMLE